jgi:ureidoglycolate lyase
MRLVRYGPSGLEKPGLLDTEGRIRDLSGTVPDIAGDVLSPADLARLAALNPTTLPLVPVNPRLGVPLGGVGKIIGVGLNYADHAAEVGQPIPKEPTLFLKATSALNGPNDDVMVPRGSQKLDYEVELGVVIGSVARHVDEADALRHVAGYCIVNDVSERDFQFNRGGQGFKGKSCDTFAPVGPWLVTRDEVPDPGRLDLWLDVDGGRRQTGSTTSMIFSVATLVAYCSTFMSLHPGDIISTGTPPGVGMGM